MRTTRQNVSAFPTGSKRKPLYLNSEALYCANNLSRASCPDLALIDNEILPLTRKTTEGPLFVLLNNGLIEPIPRRWRAGRNLLWHPSDSPLRSQKRLKLNNKVQTPGGILVVSNGGKWKFTYTLQLKLIFRTFFLLISTVAIHRSIHIRVYRHVKEYVFSSIFKKNYQFKNERKWYYSWEGQ